MDDTSTSELKSFVLEKGCIAFIGAGLSKPPGPTWKDLVRDLAKECEVAFNESLPLADIVDTCMQKDERRCNDVLYRSLPNHVGVARTAINYIHRLPFSAVLTTNFDSWLQQQSTRGQYKKGVFVYPDLPLHNSLDGGIYYLHGHFDSGDSKASIRNLVFGRRSFEAAYTTSLLPGFLLNVFTYRNVLFVGFDPTEEHIAALLKSSAVIRRSIATVGPSLVPPKRFILWPNRNTPGTEERVAQDMAIESLRELDATPVLYDPKENDYRGLEEILYTWVQEGDLRSRPAPFRTGFDPE